VYPLLTLVMGLRARGNTAVRHRCHELAKQVDFDAALDAACTAVMG